MVSRTRTIRVSLLVAMVLSLPAVRPALQAQSTGVPADLKPLLAAPQSEMRLVVTRYQADRGLISGNYAGAAGGGGRGGGRAGGAATPTSPVPLSRDRIARLMGFDSEWQTALSKLNATRLSGAARADLTALQASVAANLKALQNEGAERWRLRTTVVPFMETLVPLIEARLRFQFDDRDWQKAAGTLTSVTREIAATRARVEAGLSGGANGLRVSPALATRGAEAADALRQNLTTWFNFYNGYDPLFTWWMPMPFKHIDGALSEYAAFLRDKVVPVNLPDTPPASGIEEVIINGGPVSKYSSVPDLAELIALPQDEMTPIVQLYSQQGGGGRGGRAGAPAPGQVADRRQYFTAWLKALTSLDFDKLSRNAQADYLYIKKNAETEIARLDFVPPANPPRKTDNSGIQGPARGREGLIFDLTSEMIPYTPEELIALANKELTWQLAEMKKAARAMGLGDDWKKAIERTKDQHAPPGGQPAVIRDLLYEAIDYLRAKDLITVPQVAAESLRMSMMSPQRQLSNPFFTGGAQITVSYPTDTMEYDARIQSMRGNTTGFSHATAHHEMIPGHNLVGYMGGRFGAYRADIGGNTSFFGEGWPVYWETILYDMGFHDSPEERVGALFWLMHRSARIIFSLNFHMGIWSPQECIDFLVDTVGHERDNATAEVRRSFDPQFGYGPLYQAAYLLGALQLRGLKKDLVDSGQMTLKQFHDEIMRQGSMRIPLLRLTLLKQRTRDMTVDWKFYGENPGR
jgi:uncharacterized protein (DUF885 family)